MIEDNKNTTPDHFILIKRKTKNPVAIRASAIIAIQQTCEYPKGNFVCEIITATKSFEVDGSIDDVVKAIMNPEGEQADD